MGRIQLKRVYEPVEESDGLRVLVERLWPRGIAKEKASLDHWLKAVSPSPELRRWYGHDPEKWPEFQERYAAELRQHEDALETLRDWISQGDVTLVYSARDEERNSALLLKKFLDGA